MDASFFNGGKLAEINPFIIPEKIDQDLQSQKLAEKEIEIQKLLKEIEEKRKRGFPSQKG